MKLSTNTLMTVVGKVSVHLVGGVLDALGCCLFVIHPMSMMVSEGCLGSGISDVANDWMTSHPVSKHAQRKGGLSHHPIWNVFHPSVQFSPIWKSARKGKFLHFFPCVHFGLQNAHLEV